MKGFTLIEILVVVALIAILTTVTFVSIKPAKNFADARDVLRNSDIVQILNAITQYTSEQGHTLTTLTPVTDENIVIPICTGSALEMATIGTAAGNVNLVANLVDLYIVGIPFEPLGNHSTTDSGYVVCQTAGGIVQIDAPGAEEAGKTITERR